MQRKTVLAFVPAGYYASGMGRDLYEHHPKIQVLYTDINREATRILGAWIHGGPLDLPAYAFGASNRDLAQEKNFVLTQLVTFTHQAAVWEIYKEQGGMPPSAVIGFSRGLTAALYACGSITLAQAAEQVILGSQFVQAASKGDRMALVENISAQGLGPILEAHEMVVALEIAPPRQVVLSGPRDGGSLEGAVVAAGGLFKESRVPIGAHNPRLKDYRGPEANRYEDFQRRLQKEMKPPRLALWSGLEPGLRLDSVAAIAREIAATPFSMVPWGKALQALGHSGIDDFVQIGAHNASVLHIQKSAGLLPSNARLTSLSRLADFESILLDPGKWLGRLQRIMHGAAKADGMAGFIDNPFERLKPGERRRIGDRVFFVEPCGTVTIHWSQPIDFKTGDPINVVNTGMGGLELIYAWGSWLMDKKTANKYWFHDGLAAALCRENVAVAHIVGAQSDLRSVRQRTLWEVMDDRVRQPVEAIGRRYPRSPLRLFGLSLGALLQACYIAQGGQGERAVWINAPFQFGNGAAKLLNQERWLRRRLLGGDDRFLEALLPGTPASSDFLEALQGGFEASRPATGRVMPILLVATSTPEGGEWSWPFIPKKIARYYSAPDTDGLVNQALARNEGPQGRPLIPRARVRWVNGISHNQAQNHPAIHDIIRLFAASPAHWPTGNAFNVKTEEEIRQFDHALNLLEEAAGHPVDHDSPAVAVHQASPFPTVLVVDDEESNRSSIAGLLVDFGYTVLSAVNGRQALEKLSAYTVDLVLSDWGMHTMDGAQLIGRIKQKYPGLEVLLMSAFSDLPEKARELEVQWIFKPFNVGELIPRVASLIKPRRPVQSPHLSAQSG